jgi:hypothetical protein
MSNLTVLLQDQASRLHRALVIPPNEIVHRNVKPPRDFTAQSINVFNNANENDTRRGFHSRRAEHTMENHGVRSLTATM